MGDRERSDFRAYWVEHVRARAGRLSHFWQQVEWGTAEAVQAPRAASRARLPPTLAAAENVMMRRYRADSAERVDG